MKLDSLQSLSCYPLEVKLVDNLQVAGIPRGGRNWFVSNVGWCCNMYVVDLLWTPSGIVVRPSRCWSISLSKASHQLCGRWRSPGVAEAYWTAHAGVNSWRVNGFGMSGTKEVPDGQLRYLYDSISGKAFD